MEFHDALTDKVTVVVIVDWHRFACAWAGIGEASARLAFGPAGAAEYMKETGAILDGVEVKEDEA